MSKLILNQDPFEKNEEVVLYWLCSPFKNRNGNWTLRAVFKRATGELKEVYYPWGTLPGLFIGGIYKDGLYTEKSVLRESIDITIPPNIKYKIDECFKIPPLLYNFYNKLEYGKQMCCIFTINNTVYYIPCIEIIRSILCPYKFLLHRVIEPYSFKNLILKEEISNKYIKLFFSNDFPTTLTTKTALSHITWLNYNKKATHIWNEIYQSRLVYCSRYENPINLLEKSIPLAAGLPFDSKVTLSVKGVRMGNHFTILEITQISGLKHPFFILDFDHPKTNKPTAKSLPTNSKRTRRGFSGDIHLDDSGDSSEKTIDRIINKGCHVKISYETTPILIKKTNKIYKPLIKHSNITNAVNAKSLPKLPSIGTTHDTARDGQIQPLEFNAIKGMKNDGPTEGLEDFIKVIGIILNTNTNLQLSVNTYFFPAGKKISVYEERETKRTYCLVQVFIPNTPPTYIMEIGRADGWPISTIFIKPQGNIDSIDAVVSKLIQNLLNNGGHWDIEKLKNDNNLLIKLAKHISGQELHEWALRIVEKL